MELTASMARAGWSGKRRAVGALGGTFDPPHYGHLVGAQEVQAILDLERVLFVPTGHPPHKQDEPVTDVVHRVRMVEMAVAGNPVFELCLADVERPGPSFTVDLVPTLQARLGEDTELYFLVGGDSAQDLPLWREPAELLQRCRLVVFTRPGCPEPDLGELEHKVPGARDRIISLSTPGVDISSSELRRRVRQGQPIRYLVPDAVERYIREQGLYGRSS